MDIHRSGRIVVGVDHSLSGLQAMRRAVAEARVRDLPLRALRAWNPRPSSAYSSLYDQHQDEAAAESRLVTNAFADTMGGMPPDVTVETVLVPDSPGPALVRHAYREDDLLVIGSGRRQRWRRMGSTARYCLARATCPVLVVPPPQLAEAGSHRALLRQLRREIKEFTSDGSG